MGRLLINPSFSLAERDRSGSGGEFEACAAVIRTVASQFWPSPPPVVGDGRVPGTTIRLGRLPAPRREIGGDTCQAVSGEFGSEPGHAGRSSNVVATESDVRCNWSSPTATDAVSDPVGHSAVSKVIASSHV
jgi:hypothetical protein